MKSSSTISKILSLAEKIHFQTRQVLSEENFPAQIEKDVILHDIRILYELLNDLPVKKLSETITHSDDTPSLNKANPVDPNQSVASDSIYAPFSSFNDTVASTESSPNSATFDQTTGNSLSGKESEQLTQFSNDTIPQTSDSASDRASKSTLRHNLPQTNSRLAIDRFVPPKTLSDKLLNQEDNSLATRLQKNKLTDIRAAIGINDKFTFVNELFGGNNEKYQHAIEQLNQANTLEEALQLISFHIVPSDTPESKEALDRFREIITRKFK